MQNTICALKIIKYNLCFSDCLLVNVKGDGGESDDKLGGSTENELTPWLELTREFMQNLGQNSNSTADVTGALCVGQSKW